MKKSLLVFLLLPFFAHSQSIFQKEFSYTYAFYITDIAQLPDNGYLGCGWTKTDAIDSTFAVIVRFDSLLNYQWFKRYTMQARDDFRCITPSSDGNYFVGGKSKSEFSLYYGSTLYKIDDMGNVLWHKLYNGDYDDATIGCFEQADNTLVLIVRYGVTGQPSKVIKTDAMGNLLNKFDLSTTNVTSGVIADCVASNGMGEYYIGGTALNSNTSKYMHYVCCVVDNNLIWYKEYDYGRQSAYLYGIETLSDGNIAVTGNVKDANNPDIVNSVIMKIDPTTGEKIWAKEIKQEEDYYQAGGIITSLSNNEMMLCGRTNTENGYEGYATKLDLDGNIVWTREYGEGDYEGLSYVAEVTGNRLFFSGIMALNQGPYFIQTDANGISACLTGTLDFIAYDLPVATYSPQTILEDPDVEVLTPAFVEEDIMLSEELICTAILDIEETVTPTSYRVFPNPSNRNFTIENTSSSTSCNSIQISNLEGKTIHKFKMCYHKHTVKNRFDPGIYFITIKNSNNQIIHRQKLVVR